MRIPTSPACVLSYQWLCVHFPRKIIPRSIQIPGTSADIIFLPSCHCCRLLLHRAAPWGGVQHAEEDTGQCEPTAIITGLRQRSVRMHMIRCREPLGEASLRDTEWESEAEREKVGLLTRPQNECVNMCMCLCVHACVCVCVCALCAWTCVNVGIRNFWDRS
jgi:hypothetical protein